MSHENDKFRAEDAKQLLANPMLQSAFKAVEGYLQARALLCDSDSKDMAHRIVLSMKILAEIKREIERHIDNGLVADIRIAEVERKKRFNIFQR